MRLIVQHSTHYQYDLEQRYVVQSHRLLPAKCDTQKIYHWQVECVGAQFGEYFTDGAGDQIRIMSIEKPVTELDIVINAEVETVDKSGIVRVKDDMTPKLVYLRTTKNTEASEEMRAIAEDIKPKGVSQLDLAHLLCEYVAATIKYQKGSTESHFTAQQVFKQKEGVCQDQTQVLISFARLLKIPARYVIGYLFDSSGEIADNATHAWAELYIEELGWVGFDVANHCCPDDKYIRIGCGLDAEYAAPIKGISNGTGEQTLRVSVQIQQ